MKRSRLVFVLLVLLGSLVVPCQARYKDFSTRGGEFAVLAPLRLKAREVVYKGLVDSEWYGNHIPASRFEFTADITVQTSCNGTVSATFDRVVARYEMIVGDDRDFRIHNAMLNDIHLYWLEKNAISQIGYGNLPGEKHLFYKEGQYVLFEHRQGGKEGYDDLWLDGKAIRVEFKELVKGNGWGAGRSFMDELVSYRVGGKDIRSGYQSTFPPKRFLELFDAGAFRRS